MKESFGDMKAKRKPILAVFLIAVILGLMGNPLIVCAAEATVTFGSNWYNKSSGDTFPVGVYLNAKTAIGDYHIEIKYDNLRLQYVDGADDVDEENGILILEGNQNNRRIKFWLRFQAVSGGEALIEVSSADVKLRNSTDGETFTITEYDSAPVHLKGEDTAAEIEARLEEAERVLEEEGGGSVGEGGNTGQQAENSTGEAGSEGQPTESGAEETESGGQPTENGGTEETESGGQWTENGGTEGTEGGRQPAGNPEGESGNVGQQADSGVEGAKGIETGKNLIFFNVYFVFAGIVILIAVIIDVAVWNILKKIRRRNEEKEQRTSNKSRSGNFEDEFEFIDLDSPEERVKSSIPIMLCDEELEWQFGRPVIKICDVTMEFKLSSVNPSGLKEYIVQLIKREVSYRKLYALYHVSFNIYKGEVIGIIGTNGSGKSTLLKIVSGVLKPTSGYVDTGRRRIQLLTLGTGFDLELTARENVFLNGAIIGYRKEFLETHYDEIVEFAELQDFMEEKVKNFSSGMVSRLGFAIATAGDAAEILILDEILSVGDEFFRQKSLKRIKEMIHGGSTVLMVSHSMGTILEHCSRCVWIEKGELQMVGEPRAVCEEYRRMNE